MKIVNSNYKIKALKKPNEYMKKNDCVGYCDFVNKEIVYLKEADCLLHELLHAELYEYKRFDLATDEEIVETLEAIFKDIKMKGA